MKYFIRKYRKEKICELGESAIGAYTKDEALKEIEKLVKNEGYKAKLKTEGE